MGELQGSNPMDLGEMEADAFSNFTPSSFDAVTAQNMVDQHADSTAIDSVQSDVYAGYMLQDENKWGWITLYVVTITVAVLGNLLFIVGSLCTSRSRNTGHYLLMNLSVRDILLAGLCIPATLDSEIINMTWNLGLEYCISFRWVT